MVLANLPELAHLVDANPLVLYAGVSPVGHTLLPGGPYIDPNAGFTTQALGHLAALDWLHGHVPWWNPFEGLGQPLAGEMQSGAFFPLTILLALHSGLRYEQVLLELLSGYSTYFLVRRLGVGRTIATGAGVAFGLCGTFSWFAHAPIRPVAFLPLALSILAGFPETTAIDALFVVLWALLRLPAAQESWRALAAKLATGALVGVGIALPLVVAFVTFLPDANVAQHAGAIAHVSLPSLGLTQVLLPYGLGPIFAFHQIPPAVDQISSVWGSVGGYLDATLVLGALVGLVGRPRRLLRIGLGAWILVCLARTFGFPPVVDVMAHLPGLDATAFYRYANPSWALAAVVLAALGFDDLARRRTPRVVLLTAAGLTGIGALWAAATDWAVLDGSAGPTPGASAHLHAYVAGSLAFALGAIAAVVLGGLLARGPRPAHSPGLPRVGRLVLAGALGVEALVLFAFPAFSAPLSAGPPTGAIAWLQENLGTARFVTLGPIAPNYGSYFGIAEADVNDNPVPQAWTSYIVTDLDPNALSVIFNGLNMINPAGPSAAQELSAHLAAYEAVGIRYVVEASSGLDNLGHPFPPAGSPSWPAGPRKVYAGPTIEIWELPHAAPAFSATTARGQPCQTRIDGWDAVTLTCPGPATLVRRAEDLPGWSASVNGTPSALTTDPNSPGKLFGQVSVPAGTSRVTFIYLPPHEVPALALAVLVESARRARRQDAPGRMSRDHVPAAGSGEEHHRDETDHDDPRSSAPSGTTMPACPEARLVGVTRPVPGRRSLSSGSPMAHPRPTLAARRSAS